MNDVNYQRSRGLWVTDGAAAYYEDNKYHDPNNMPQGVHVSVDANNRPPTAANPYPYRLKVETNIIDLDLTTTYKRVFLLTSQTLMFIAHLLHRVSDKSRINHMFMRREVWIGYRAGRDIPSNSEWPDLLPDFPTTSVSFENTRKPVVLPRTYAMMCDLANVDHTAGLSKHRVTFRRLAAAARYDLPKNTCT